jgi:hypothetical protein
MSDCHWYFIARTRQAEREATMSKRKLVCADCGSDEHVLKSKGVPLCIKCGISGEWNGEHIFKSEPTACPVCGGMVEPPDVNDVDNFDEERAIACGFDPDVNDEFEDEWERFHYGYDELWCQECDRIWAYEPVYYWNPTTAKYDTQVPKTPAEILADQLKAQEAAGQLRLFCD